MHFMFNCFYLLYIFRSVVVVSSELEFHVKIWGNKGLLISWDPKEVANADEKYFHFTGESFLVQERGSVAEGQYRLRYPLNQDERYEITIEEYIAYPYFKYEYIVEKNYTLNGLIDLKNISPPEKPSLKLEIIADSIAANGNFIKITWIPCGEERNCHGNEPGTHFAVQLKILDLRSSEKIIEYYNDYYNIRRFYAGHIYEITVISINGNLETNSDPQEVFFRPSSSPVHSVKIYPLSNISTLISWKEPKQTAVKIQSYIIAWNVVYSGNELLWDPPKYSDKNRHQVAHSKKFTMHTDTEFFEIDKLEPNTVYTYIIMPIGADNMGFEYRFDYSIQAVQSNPLLAKPDFEFFPHHYYDEDDTTCTITVNWIPCTNMFDCINMNPGSRHELTVQNEHGTTTYTEDKIKIAKKQINTVTGVSMNEFGESSESVSKTITC